MRPGIHRSLCGGNGKRRLICWLERRIDYLHTINYNCVSSAITHFLTLFILISIRIQFINLNHQAILCRSQWLLGLRCRSADARLLRLWVRIPPWTWMFVSCEWYVLSGRGLYDKLITRPEESYRLWWVVVCDLETSWMRRPWPNGGLLRQKQTSNFNKIFGG
jgi:hypothetical protein